MTPPDGANGADVPIPLQGFSLAHQTVHGVTGYGIATDGIPHIFNAGDEVFNTIYLPAISAGTLNLHYLEAGASNSAGTEKLIVAINSPIDITGDAGTNFWPSAADFSVTLQTGTDLSVDASDGQIQPAARGQYVCYFSAYFASSALQPG